MPVYNYTTLDDPLATNGAQAFGINALGQIVGDYLVGTAQHAFLYNPNGGTYTTLDEPLATNGTVAPGINDSGQIVGQYIDASNQQHGFLLINGSYFTLDDPLASAF